MNTVGYIDVVGETKLIMLELAELQKENEQLRAELSAAQDRLRAVIDAAKEHAEKGYAEQCRLQRTLNTARADAIKDCVEKVKTLPDHSALCGVWLQQVCDCDLRVEAAAALESLTKKEGNDGPQV
jgi:hypothetical protein